MNEVSMTYKVIYNFTNGKSLTLRDLSEENISIIKQVTCNAVTSSRDVIINMKNVNYIEIEEEQQLDSQTD